MEWFALIALGIALFNEEKNKKLESQINKLERKLKGENAMSKILSELINEKCILVSVECYNVGGKRELECTVIDVDDEWIKFSFIDKKGVNKTSIIRVKDIERIKCIEEKL